MYKAVNRLTGEEYLVLHPQWRERVHELRALSQAGLAACQACQQPVVLRAGNRKRMHFAHRHLRGCSLAEPSGPVMEGIAVLYDWMYRLAPGDVQAEVLLPGLPRPLDLARTAEDGRRIAYWIVDRLLRSDQRERIAQTLSDGGYEVVWVMLERILRLDDAQPGKRKRQAWLRLSPCERACMRQTPYDEIGRENRLLPQEFGSTLYYLDAGNAAIRAFRSLERVHPPNIFSGREESCALSDLRLDERGEFCFPGEKARLARSRGRAVQFRETVQRWLGPRQGVVQPRLAEPGDEVPQPRVRDAGMGVRLRAVRCVHCGQVTEDWWTAWDEQGERLGKCRSCLEKGLG